VPSPQNPFAPRPGAPEPPIILDDRERASGLHEELARLMGRPPRIQRLEVGDVLIRSRVLIERKAAADFEASILDGRLFAQARALVAQPFDPLIIVEGAFNREHARLTGSALRGALLTLSLDWRLPVLRSASLADTALWIRELAGRGRARREPPDWRAVSPSGSRRPAAARLSAPRKPPVPADLRQRRQTQAILAAIEGVGPVRAEALAREFGSLAGVIAAGHDALASVPGVGTRLAARIRLALNGEAPPQSSPGSR
jgi:ERCC4-type nuclease